ncbi:MAG: hypothetical protein OEV92_07830 [Nitrospinota bacterium]|nr:hypothetical protein [Nitrospinota bacterium]
MNIRAWASIALILAITAGGCVTPSAGIDTPTAITAAKRDKVKTGLTRDEIISLLGEPESRLALQDGETLFFKDVNLSSVWVHLDKTGKVRDWEWSE